MGDSINNTLHFYCVLCGSDQCFVLVTCSLPTDLLPAVHDQVSSIHTPVHTHMMLMYCHRREILLMICPSKHICFSVDIRSCLDDASSPCGVLSHLELKLY